MSDNYRRDHTRFIWMLCFIAFCLATGVIAVCDLDENRSDRFEACVQANKQHPPLVCSAAADWEYVRLGGNP